MYPVVWVFACALVPVFGVPVQAEAPRAPVLRNLSGRWQFDSQRSDNVQKLFESLGGCWDGTVQGFGSWEVGAGVDVFFACLSPVASQFCTPPPCRAPR